MVSDAEETTRRNRSQSWWRQRTHMERSAIFFLIIAVLIIIGLIVGLVLAIRQTKKNQSETVTEYVCAKTNITSGYVEAAANIIRYIDQSLDPCDDFYQFACGRFLKETQIPDDKSEVSSFSIVRDVVQQQLKGIIETSSSTNEPISFSLVKTLYNACINTTLIEFDNATTIKQLFDDVGGWPVLAGDDWNEDKFDWKKLLYKFRENGLNINYFFELGITSDPKNSSRRTIIFDQANLEIARNNLIQGFDDEVVQAYYYYMVDLAVLFGANKESAEQEVKDMIEFRILLANITVPEEERRNYTTMYNPMTIGDLQRTYSSIPWLDLIIGLLAVPIKPVSYVDTVVITNPEQLHHLETLLKSSKRAQANYVFFKTLRELQPYLPERMRNREQEFLGLLQGITAHTPRWSECVSIVSESLNIATGAMYVRKYSNEDVKDSAMNIVTDIKDELVKMIQTIDWMDEETRKEAIDKALTITSHVAYANELLDDSKLEEYYAGLTFDYENFLQLRNKIEKFKTDKDCSQLWEPLNKTDWATRLPSMTVNAGYAPTENSIQLPAGILQTMVFAKDRPSYLNYAAIGYIIGHEITHGFDDQGKQFDKEGNLLNWWAEETDAAFLNKSECIVDQYAGYIVPEVGLHLNGINTQGENIADNGGIKEAYLAYNAWIKRNGPEPPLPGLNYTAKQTFWIAAANVWCTKERNQFLEADILADEHSPSRYRIIVPFSNSDYFAKDFNCPAGSKMNPKHKCKVW